jgi:opine dehydrogenase
MRIIVLGAGNAGATLACWLQKRHDVRIWNRSAGTPESFIVNDTWTSRMSLGCIDGDFSTAEIDSFDIIVLSSPSDTHVELAKAICPHIRAGQHIVLHPCNIFGGETICHIVQMHRPDLMGVISVSELSYCLFACRRNGSCIKTSEPKKSVTMSTQMVDGKNATNSALKTLDAAFNDLGVRRVGSFLDTTFTAYGNISHPAINLVNCAGLERQDKFLYYKQGSHRSSSVLTDKMYHEVLALATALGVSRHYHTSFLAMLNQDYGPTDCRTIHEFDQSNQHYDTIMAPDRPDTRYLCEELSAGLLPLLHLGDALGIEMPVIRSICSIWTILFPMISKCQVRCDAIDKWVEKRKSDQKLK